MNTSDKETVVGSFRDAVNEVPNRFFIDFEGRAFTFADIWSRSSDVARGLRNAGVEPGDTVVSMLDNNEDCLATWIGANMLGAIWVSVNTALRGEFLRHVVSDSSARVAICEADLLNRFTAVAGRSDVELVLVRGENNPAKIPNVRVEPLEGYRIEGNDDPYRPSTRDDISMLIYTGGTTGPSKGCTNSNGFVLNVARRYVECTGREKDELNWSPLPMFHFNVVAQTIMSSVLLRGTASVAQRSPVSQFWPEIERTGARVVNLLGSMGSLIAQMPDVPEMQACWGQIRYLHGAPFPPEIRKVWQSRFNVRGIGGYYGMTEAVPLTLLHHDEVAPANCAGRVNDEDFEVRIVDDKEEPVPPGELGEILVRPKRRNVMFDGYWQRPEATLEATRNLWFHTGDLALIDEEGFFYFKDRKKDAIRRRGENISSIEVETVYLGHPAIGQVAVHAVPSELTEEDVKVSAVLVDGESLTPLDLFRWSIERLPHFALPRYIEFRRELPVSPTGRIHKHLLRSEGVTTDTWDRELDLAAVWERR